MSDTNNIIADQKYQSAIAERGKFFPVDTDYLTSIGYPTSGTLGTGKYAVLTYQINPTTTTVETTSDVGDVASDGVTQMGGIAESSVPTAVDDGDAVAMWFNTYGQQIIAGFNASLQALDVNNVSDPIISRLGPITNLDSVTATGTGTSVNVTNYHNYTIHIVASSVTTGCTVTVQDSLDAINWATISTTEITEDGVTEITLSDQAYKYLRTVVTSRTDGTISTYIFAGN